MFDRPTSLVSLSSALLWKPPWGPQAEPMTPPRLSSWILALGRVVGRLVGSALVIGPIVLTLAVRGLVGPTLGSLVVIGLRVRVVMVLEMVGA